MYVRLGCVKTARPRAGGQAGKDEPCIPKLVGAWTASQCSFLLLLNVDIPNHDVLSWHLCIVLFPRLEPSGGDIKSNGTCKAVTPNDTGRAGCEGWSGYAEISVSGIPRINLDYAGGPASRLPTAMASTTLVWQTRGLSGWSSAIS